MARVAISYPFVPTTTVYRDGPDVVTWGEVPRHADHVVTTGYDHEDADYLLTLEPPTVLPKIWDGSYRARFGAVFSHDPRPGEHRVRYPWPFGWPALPARPVRIPWEERRPAVCVVTGNRASTSPVSLYHRRQEIIGEIERHGYEVHVYGRPRWDGPGRYCGELALGAKVATMAQYRYALALENTDQDGYFTEKLPEVLAAGCAPAYLGHRGTAEYVIGEQARSVYDLSRVRDWPRWHASWSAETHREYLDRLDLEAIRAYMSTEALCSSILSCL